jgi:ubiquinone/menaquinone biosynthesis C-methylase UbiE
MRNKMNITFEAPLGQRILRNRFTGITVFGESSQPFLWWCHATRKWVTSNTPMPQGGSTHADCKSYRAFLRHLRKHPELKGYEVYLVSRFRDNNIIARP